MSQVRPIEKFSDIRKIRQKLTEWGNIKEAELFWVGCHVGLRASDLIDWKFKTIEDADEYMKIRENKTGKDNEIEKSDVILESVEILKKYYREKHQYLESVYLFQGTGQTVKNKCAPITVDWFRKKIKEVTEALGMKDNFGSHTMRKTFGYHLYQQTEDIELVSSLLNHASTKVTQVYIGLDREKKRETRRGLRF